MKKILHSLLLVTFISGFSINTVACNKIKYDNKVWLITDGGTITDNSFNEYAYKGANNYVQNNKGNNFAASYYEVADSIANDYYTGYKIANISGAKAIVLAGFKHQAYLKEEHKYSPNNLILDAANNISSWLSSYQSNGIYEGLYKNVIGVDYEAEIAAFKAALLTFFYMNSNYNNQPTKNNVYKFSTFGGIDSNSVYSYMWGIISASLLFNDYVDNKLLSNNLKTILEEMKNNFNITSGNLKKFELIDTQQNQINDPTNFSDGTWFSGSFIPGLGSNISNSLIQNGSDLIMPVAGGQINDVLNQATKFNKNLKVIGVDSPQASIFNPLYPSLKNPVITSAEKDLPKTTSDVLVDLLDNNDSNKWLGKTITAPLSPYTNNWLKVEQPPNLETDKYNKIIDNINKILNLGCNYDTNNDNNDVKDLKHELINWFTKNKGLNFLELLKNSSKFNDDIIINIV